MRRGKHTLMREGARGRATVLREQRRGAGTRDWRQYVDGRFQSPDGSSVEFTDHILQSDIGSDFLAVGDAVPVRYDPRDPTRIVLDVPALLAEIGARHAGLAVPDLDAAATAPAATAPVAGSAAAATAPAVDAAQPGTAPQPGTARSGLAPDEVMAAVEQMAQLGELRHRGALTDERYQAEKVALQADLRKRLGLS
ncbi:MAG: DUF3592 domain-containing protein [Solirubrobacteraceae bacterium]